MKNFKFILAFIILFCLIPQVGHASTVETQIFYNGKQIPLSSQSQVKIVHNQVMIPIRLVVEEIGYEVKWNKVKNEITIKENNHSINFTVNQATATVDGSAVKLNNPVMLSKGTSFIPLRFVGEQMGLDVQWDSPNRSVLLTTPTDVMTPSSDTTIDSSENTDAIPEFQSDPRYLKGTTLINAISYSDNRLLISSSDAITPKIFAMSNPERIVIDLPQTAFSNSFGQGQALDQNNHGQLEASNDASISSIRYSLFKNDPSTVRVVIDTHARLNYKVDTSSQNTLLVDLSPIATTPPIDSLGSEGKKIVVIDAGHGDYATGTIGASNTLEKNFNLAVALKVEAILKQQSKVDVVMTRSDDTYVTLNGRPKIANDIHADAFISIHANAATTKPSPVTGTESYYYNDLSLSLATVMHKHLMEATEFKDRGVKTNRFVVLKRAEMPATLLEIGFISNAEQEAILFTDSFQDRVAQGIVDGINDYFQLN